MDNNVFRDLSYGVYIVCTMNGDKPTGCTANSTMQVTSSPATIAVSINHDNFTNECIKKSGKFSVSIIAEDSLPLIIGTFGFRSGRDFNKFENIQSKMVEGVPVITDACGCIVCKVIDKMETSTHTVFLGEVIQTEKFEKTKPMTYAYYHNVIKGTSPKAAPTYIEENK